MTKIGRPKNLIAYDTIANQEATACGKTAPFKIVRPRTLLYVAMMALVSAIMLAALLARTVLEINVIADRNPPFVRLSDGGVRNGYTIKILNKLHEPRNFQLTVKGLPDAKLTIVGLESEANPVIRVATDDLRELRIFVTVPRDGLAKLSGGHAPFELVIRDIAADRVTTRSTKFQSP